MSLTALPYVEQVFSTPIGVSLMPDDSCKDSSPKALVGQYLSRTLVNTSPKVPRLANVETMTLFGGMSRILGAGLCDIEVIWLQAATVQYKHKEAGKIFVYDPRCGASAAFMRSGPFGKPMVFLPFPNLVLIVPSYLQWMIAPLGDDDLLQLSRYIFVLE